MNKVSKIVFIAPALNQEKLQRYYFAQKLRTLSNLSTTITWGNFESYYTEEVFIEALNHEL